MFLPPTKDPPLSVHGAFHLCPCCSFRQILSRSIAPSVALLHFQQFQSRPNESITLPIHSFLHNYSSKMPHISNPSHLRSRNHGYSILLAYPPLTHFCTWSGTDQQSGSDLHTLPGRCLTACSWNSVCWQACSAYGDSMTFPCNQDAVCFEQSINEPALR